MSVQYSHPKSFSTNCKPTLDVSEDRIQYTFDSLLGRQGMEFFFVDYVFQTRPNGIHGAVGSTMSPVHEETAERQKQNYKSKERSPLFHLYEKEDPSQSWESWIESQFDRDGLRVIYDPSYNHKYGEQVRELTYEEGLYEQDKVVFVECIGGGRMFNSIDRDLDKVYDPELLKIVTEAEENGVVDF